MKRNLKRIMTIVLVSACVMSANAQAENPVKGEQKSAVLKITRNNKVITKTTEKDTIVAKKTTINQVSDSFKVARYEARLAGQEAPGTYFDNHNRDIEGHLLSRPFIEAGVGGRYLFENKEFRPELLVNVGWKARYFLLMATGQLGLKGFNKSDDVSENGVALGAEAEGRYTTFTGMLGGGPVLWNSDNFLSYFALVGQAGYEYRKSDGDSEEIRFSSSNYGFKWRGFVRFHYGFNNHWGFSVDAGVCNTVVNYHDSEQDTGSITGELTATLSYSF